jgi:tellurite resistance protein
MNLETDNPEKGQLLQRSEHHRELLEEEVRLVTEKTEKMITNALIIGGALAVTYFVVSSLSSSGKKEKARSKRIKLTPASEGPGLEQEVVEPAQAGIVSAIGSALVAQATGLLLSIAREKLLEFLQSHAAKKDNPHERS